MTKLYTRIIARAVIQKGKNILLCHAKDAGHFYFPGGHVEFREGAEAALRREIQEELGIELLHASFIGAVEHLFVEGGEPSHELNLVFLAQIDEVPIVSREAHIDFRWVAVSELERENVLPRSMVTAVLQWLHDGKTFWVGLNKE